MGTFGTAGAIAALIAVGAGAFGAHALRSTLEPRILETFETAVRYQMYHALALLAVGWAVERYGVTPFSASGWLFVAGIVLFSGSLYLLVFTGIRWLGAVTPAGGLCFLAGWAVLAYGLWKHAG